MELSKLLNNYRVAVAALDAITYRPTGKLGMLEDHRFDARSIYRLTKKFFVAVGEGKDSEYLADLLRHIGHGLTYIIDETEEREFKIQSTLDSLYFLYQVEKAHDALFRYYA